MMTAMVTMTTTSVTDKYIQRVTNYQRKQCSRKQRVHQHQECLRCSQVGVCLAASRDLSQTPTTCWRNLQSATQSSVYESNDMSATSSHNNNKNIRRRRALTCYAAVRHSGALWVTSLWISIFTKTIVTLTAVEFFDVTWPWPLTFSLKLAHHLSVPWGTFVPILSFIHHTFRRQ